MLQDRTFDSHIVSVIHDEIVIDATLVEIPFLVMDVPKMMDYAPVSSVVPILTDTEWSTTSWADKVNYDGRYVD